MSVKVRLQRGGRIHLPVYSIVVTDSRTSRDGKFIERLGFYAPKAKGQEVPFSMNEERLSYWVGVGAQVTDVVARLLVKHAVGPQKVRDAVVAKKARRIKAEGAVKAWGEKRTAAKAAREAAAEAEAAKAAAAAEAAAAKAAEAAAKAAEAEAAKAAAAAAEAPAEAPAA